MNKKEFREITELLELNYGKEMDTRILELWYQEFKPLTKEQYHGMVLDAIRNENFMPSLAKMISYKKPSWFYTEYKPEEATPEERAEIENILKEFK